MQRPNLGKEPITPIYCADGNRRFAEIAKADAPYEAFRRNCHNIIRKSVKMSTSHTGRSSRPCSLKNRFFR